MTSIVATVKSELVHVPPAIFELAVVDEPAQMFPSVILAVPASGAAVTVTSTVAVASVPRHTPEPAKVYVNVAVPAPIPVTKPVFKSIVATDASELVHVPPAIVELADVVEPSQILASVMLAVPASGPAVTATSTVDVASVPRHPATPNTVYVKVAVPAPIPVTKPVFKSTVATVTSELVHVPPASVELAVVVEPSQILASVILAVPALGGKVITTVTSNLVELSQVPLV